VAGLKDVTNFGAGFNCLVNAGDQYVLPCAAGLDR